MIFGAISTVVILSSKTEPQKATTSDADNFEVSMRQFAAQVMILLSMIVFLVYLWFKWPLGSHHYTP